MCGYNTLYFTSSKQVKKIKSPFTFPFIYCYLWGVTISINSHTLFVSNKGSCVGIGKFKQQENMHPA